MSAEKAVLEEQKAFDDSFLKLREILGKSEIKTLQECTDLYTSSLSLVVIVIGFFPVRKLMIEETKPRFERMIFEMGTRAFSKSGIISLAMADIVGQLLMLQDETEEDLSETCELVTSIGLAPIKKMKNLLSHYSEMKKELFTRKGDLSMEKSFEDFSKKE